MAEYLSPGIFIEEVPSTLQVIAGVSTSTAGIIGFTTRGPTDTATLIGSFEEYQRVFGGLTQYSFTPLEVAAYFANGGKRAYIVRVIPNDAAFSDGYIGCKTYDQIVATNPPGGVVAGTLLPATPVDTVRYGSLTFRWRAVAGAPTLASPLMQRDGVTPLVGNAVLQLFEGRIDPVAFPNFGADLDPLQFGADPGVNHAAAFVPPAVGPCAAVIRWTTLAVPKSVEIPLLLAATGDTATGTNGAGSTVTFSYRTGFFTLSAAGAEVPDAAPITIDFFAMTADRTATDSYVAPPPIPTTGTIVSADIGAPGSIDYTTGVYTFTITSNLPGVFHRVLLDWQENAWDMDPISKGVWGDDLKVRVTGNIDNFTAATSAYSKFNVTVLLRSSITGSYEVVETYEALVFDDPTDLQYFADVINELSDYISINTPAGDLVVRQLNGRSQSYILGGGTGLAQYVANTTLIGAPIAPRSVSITYTDGVGTKTITDDGAGGLIGDVLPAAVNSIDYDTGAIQFTTNTFPLIATFITASYYRRGEELQHEEIFQFGSDGDITDPLEYGRNQFTAPTLIAGSRGMYALNRVEDILQVIIPDFVGDVTITGDMLDYAELRAALPSGGDRYIILGTPRGSSAQEAVDWLRYELGRYSKYAAVYWPWIKVQDPLTDRPILLPPVGHIAGIFARTDGNKNVGKSPGGTVDGALNFLIGLELDPTQAERDLVYQNRINPLISSIQTGRAVWGVRQIAQEPEWRYINARRLFMFVEKAVYNSTAWIVFENNNEALWARIRLSVQAFLNNLFTQGYFAGTTPAEAFFVICDETNNPPEVIEAGQVIIDVGLAPNKPAEFVRFRFQQMTMVGA